MNHVRYEVIKKRQEGLSYNELSSLYKIPKSTLSGWLSNINLNAEARNRIKKRVAQGTLNGLIQRNKLQTVIARQRAQDIRKNASTEFPNLLKNNLFLIGTILYWAEGYKRPRYVNGRELTNHMISFTNSDPEMIQIFIIFLQKLLCVSEEKIKLNIRIFRDIDKASAVRYWLKITSLNTDNIENVSTIISRASRNLRPFNRLPFGTIQVRVNNTEKFHRLMGWIDGIKNLKIFAKTNKV